MTKVSKKLSGIIPPMITPLTENGKIDVAGLEQLVDHMIEGGVSGIFVLGSSGEGPWLTIEQQTFLVTQVERYVAGRVPILAGALEPSTARTQEAIIRHSAAGADIVVITSPYYFSSDDSVQIQHFEKLIASSPLPVMLYNIPPTTHNPISPETVKHLLKMKNLIGIKDSAGDWSNFLDLLEHRLSRPDFVVFQGAEKLSLRSIIAGADGVVPGLGNIVPVHFVEIIQLIQSGNTTLAKVVQDEIDELWTLHTYDFWLVCLKFAASLLGYGSGVTIGHPMTMDNNAQEAISSLLNTTKNKLHR